MKVYIAGPYTKGDVAVNVRNAMEAANDLMEMGHTPYIPHLTHFQHLAFPQPYTYWLAYDLEWLRVCDALLRLEGESSGADAEVAEAHEQGIPVYLNLLDLAYRRAVEPAPPPGVSGTPTSGRASRTTARP